MKETVQRRPLKDERDKQIETEAKCFALELLTTVTQILTIMCAIKGNPAWKGSLSLLFFGAAFILLYKYGEYREKLYVQVSVILFLIGVALLIWFGITG